MSRARNPRKVPSQSEVRKLIEAGKVEALTLPSMQWAGQTNYRRKWTRVRPGLYVRLLGEFEVEIEECDPEWCPDDLKGWRVRWSPINPIYGQDASDIVDDDFPTYAEAKAWAEEVFTGKTVDAVWTEWRGEPPQPPSRYLNPQNTPHERERRRLQKQGLSETEVANALVAKWPTSRTVACYVPMREHRTALTNLAKDLIKQGKAIDYRYYSKAEVEYMDAGSEPRFEITMVDNTTPLPPLAPYLEAAGIEGGFLDCYDDEYEGEYDSEGRQANESQAWARGCGDLPVPAGRVSLKQIKAKLLR